MVTELAMLTCAPSDMDAVEQALDTMRPLFLTALGCQGLKLLRAIDRPGTFCLQVQWETLDHHLRDFLGSPALQEFERAIGPYLSAPPQITHFHVCFEDLNARSSIQN